MSKDKENPRKKGNLVEEAPRQPFTKISEAKETSQHPLHRTMSRMEMALDKLSNKEQVQEQVLEDREEWAKCVKALASSANGKLFFKVMCRHAQVFLPPVPENATKVVLNSARQEFYLKFVRPFLDANHKGEIE